MPLLKHVLHLTTITALSAVFFVGCATTQPTTTAVVETDKTPPQTVEQDPLVNQQLSAIEAFLAQEQLDEAMMMLNGLNFFTLPTEYKTRYLLAQTDAALLAGDGQRALNWISGRYTFLFDGLPLEQQIEIGLKRARAYEIAGKPLSAARERIFLAPVLSDQQMIENHEQIWFNLQLVNEEQLRDLAAKESSPDLTGWIELTLVSLNESDNLDRLIRTIKRWQLRNPTHPAAARLPNSLQILSQLASNQPTHIGVMLPLSGALEKAGNAIRDGILTSWYQAKDYKQQVPKLSFYDTASNEDIQRIYQTAVNDGVETVIGPLSKTKVQRLMQAQLLPVPVLALNYADAQIAKVDNFYQFGFPPENEAIQVANDIWQRGIRSVMVVAPQSTWGERVSDAFIQHWQQLGGNVASKALFGQPDQYLGTIKNALNVKDSETRHAILQRYLDTDLEFEFRRRDDIEMVFMAAFPAQARQLKPILNYQKAIDVPVVAISYIYAGSDDAERDKDLEGIEFIDMPWRLYPSTTRARAGQAFPQSIASYASLVALGVDAYRLYPRLPQMSAYSDVRIQGVTGAMTMDELGRIDRQLDWAVIEDGVATLKVISEDL